MAEPTGSCDYYEGESDRSAFEYFRLLSNGSSQQVYPMGDANGICVFPDATCNASAPHFSCCGLAPWAANAAAKAENINLIACIVGLVVPGQFLGWYRRRKRRKQEQQEQEQQEESDSEESGDLTLTALTPQSRGHAGDEVDTASEHAKGSDTEDGEEHWGSYLQRRCYPVLTAVVFAGVIGSEIYLLQLVAQVTQGRLSVPMRNSMLAGDAFLTPVREIFQFLEDVITVKVNAALGAGAVAAVRQILLMGVFGGVACGILAAALATGLCYWPSVFEWLLAPYATYDAHLRCPLMPEAAVAAATARPYLLLQAWCWPASFVSMAIRGFLLGSGEFMSFALFTLAQTVIYIIGLYVFFVPNPSLETLGWVGFASNWSSLLFMLGLLASRCELRTYYGIVLQRPRAQARTSAEDLDVAAEGSATQVSWREASWEGFMAMLLDVSAQLSVTIGIYIAGSMFGMGAMYQISALQAAFPQYGLQWIWGLTYFVRIQGTQLVSARKYQWFGGLFTYCVFYALVLIVIAAATILPFKQVLSLRQARQACEYATDPSCLEIYGSVFGGGTSTGGTLQGDAMTFFVPAMAARCFYQLFKAGLYACLDWDFMARVAVASFILIFVPAILVAALFARTVAAVFVAMYLPVLCMAFAFMLRTRRNIKRMLAGQPGPWEQSSAGEESSE